MKTRYYEKPHPFLSDEYRLEKRDYLRQFDMALIVTTFLTGGRISEVLMSHADNFIIEDEYIRVTGLPLLKRLKKKQTTVDVLDSPPKGSLEGKYRYSKTYDAFISIGWETEPEIGTREDFPIPRWEPFVNIMMNWIKQTEGQGGYRWLFPRANGPNGRSLREYSSGWRKSSAWKPGHG